MVYADANMGLIMGFVIRWVFAFVLLAATYNPTAWNYVSWSMTNAETNLSMVVLLGLVLFVGYIIYNAKAGRVDPDQKRRDLRSCWLRRRKRL